MATLGTTFAGAALAMGGKEKAKEKGPPINAANKDEEQFIQYVLSPQSESRDLERRLRSMMEG